MPVAKDPKRPLEIGELSWILESKIRGTYPSDIQTKDQSKPAATKPTKSRTRKTKAK